MIWNRSKFFLLGSFTRLSNILENAVKYTPAGYIKISVKSDNKYVFISIKDSGIGIPRERLKDITKEFERVDYTKPGFGLGLFIVSKSLSILKGKMGIISYEDKGTTVNIKIPL